MPNGTVLVIGASGFIGKRVAEVLEAARPGSVRRGYSRAVPPDGVLCNLADASTLRAAMRDVSVVINCARSPWGLEEGRAAARNLAGAAASTGVGKLIHMSSIAVYGSQVGLLDEGRAPGPELSEYGLEKIETERILREAAAPELRIVALRPGLVYGRNGREWFDYFVADGHLRQLRDLGPMGDGDANLVHVDDLADFCRTLADADIPEFSVANVVGDDVPSFNRYFALLARAGGLGTLPPRLEGRKKWEARRLLLRVLGKVAAKVPVPSIRLLARRGPRIESFDRYTTRIRFTTDRARELGFAPRIDVETGIRLAMDGAGKDAAA